MKTENDYLDYATKMRKALCDKHISTPEGGINHKYFLVKKGQYWSDEMQKALLSELAKVGCGNWTQMMKNELLKNSSEIELELRTCLTLGISDISKYQSKKLTAELIATEKAANKKKAIENDKLKYGIYIV